MSKARTQKRRVLTERTEHGKVLSRLLDQYMPVVMSTAKPDEDKLILADNENLFVQLENQWIDYVDRCRKRRLEFQPRSDAFEKEAEKYVEELRRAAWYAYMNSQIENMPTDADKYYPCTLDELKEKLDGTEQGTTE